MLEDMLVVWGGEFGWMVYCQGNLICDNYGWDYYLCCFMVWLVGGGVKLGIIYGCSDEYGYNIVDEDGVLFMF